METGLRGRSVLVTEVGNNLGKSTALAFAREGANLLLGSLNDGESLKEAEQEASALGVKIVSALYDAASEDEVKRLEQKGVDKFGRIDVLFNNVAFPGAHGFETISFDFWRQAIHLQLTGSLFLSRAVLPGMIKQRWGRIIHCVALEGLLGGDPATSAAHMGIVGLARGIATQYGKYNITVNCVGYGGIVGINNPLSAYLSQKTKDPLSRFGTLQELSSAAIYLASEDAGYITGQCYLVNGGKYFF